jgi:hypothetical protein
VRKTENLVRVAEQTHAKNKVQLSEQTCNSLQLMKDRVTGPQLTHTEEVATFLFRIETMNIFLIIILMRKRILATGAGHQFTPNRGTKLDILQPSHFISMILVPDITTEGERMISFLSRKWKKEKVTMI